ncbi:hypothetical protein [Kribbella solani]|uniref:Uncharacterized protein n=1 Tax=Kribbella solani TaxID=236067 RepID=A0A841DRN1_9ACTN|nr:hypothetical protein [Kribbella solani]MBB5980591.1 hypothetical protein [Kribbella solani]
MEYAEFDAERRRITNAWGEEITDPAVLRTMVENLRRQAATIPGQQDRLKADRYLETLDALVDAARTPGSETVQRASDAMQRAVAPIGTAAERRLRAEEGIAEITRIAATAPTQEEHDAALEHIETLAETLDLLDAEGDQPEAGPGVARAADGPSIIAPRSAVDGSGVGESGISDSGVGESGVEETGVDDRTAGFANDPALRRPGQFPGQRSGAAPARPTTGSTPKAPGREF